MTGAEPAAASIIRPKCASISASNSSCIAHIARKKRAVVAVARRLAVLLLALWKSGEVYEPLRHARAAEAA